jgi:hypothetical protein
LALVLPLTAACGSDDEEGRVDTGVDEGEERGGDGNGGAPSGEAAAALGAALEETQGIDTAAFTMTVESEVVGQEILMTMEGAVDFTSGAMRSTTTTESFGATQELEQVSDGTTLYQSVPEGMSYPGVDTPWISLDVSEMGGALGSPTASPDQMFQMIEDIDGEVVDEGTEDLDGTETTHYSADLGDESLDQLFESMAPMFDQMVEGGGLPADAGEVFTDAFADADITYEIDVWVGDDGLIRRTTTTMELDFGAMMRDVFGELGLDDDTAEEMLGGTAGRMATVSTMDFTEYGVPVDVEIPAPDEVTAVDFGELMAGS